MLLTVNNADIHYSYHLDLVFDKVFWKKAMMEYICY